LSSFWGVVQGMVDEIVFLGLPNDYINQQEEYIKRMTLGQHQALAEKYIEPDKMIYLILGDAKTQLKPLNELGFGQPILLDRDGNRK
jgi:zinc protease